jgi:hypothetical protein
MPDKKHEYFTVGNASRLAYPEDGLCIFGGEAPTRHDDGSTSYSLRAPVVIISSIIEHRPELADIIAEVLNENAHRFFPSAAKSEADGKIQTA